MGFLVCEDLRQEGVQQEEAASFNGVHIDELHECTGEPSRFTTLLKPCTKLKDVHAGIRIHAEIARWGLLETNVFLGSSLVTLYAKCGLLARAKEVFDKLLLRNVISWNALIAGYAQHSEGDEALSCLDRMQCEGLSPNAVTFACIAKACGSIGAVNKGQGLHAQVPEDLMLQKDAIVGNALIDMYAKCGLLAKAQEVFDNLPIQTVVAWTALIAGYAQQGHGERALNCFAQMQLKGINPNAVTLLCTLKACGNLGSTTHGQGIHAQILKTGMLENDHVIGTALVDMYANCGLLRRAQEVFNELPLQNIVSWTALIAGYAQHGLDEKAVKCYEQMVLKGLSPNIVTIVCILKACSNLDMISKGQEIHNQVARIGLLSKEIVVANAVIEMYAKCGMLGKAQEVLNGLPARNEVSWNVLIAGYVQHGHGEEALKCYEHMQGEGLTPDAITFACILKSCGSLKAGDKGCEIHKQLYRNGLLGANNFVANALVDMYAKCGMLGKAQEVHDNLLVRSVVSWNALILGYVQHGLDNKAVDCFDKMQFEGHPPDGITLTCILKACGNVGAMEKGEDIHAQFVSNELLGKDIAIANALVDMYVKCGALVKAQDVFNDLPVRSVVAYTVLITGYAQRGHGKEAFSCFERMQHEGLLPDAFTIACILKACGYIGAADMGQDIYAHIVKDGLLKEDMIVGTALLDMYVKCGLLENAQEVFDTLQVRDVSTWNSLIGGYAQLGKCELVFGMFDRMIEGGQKPDLVTFTTLLNLCSQRALVDEGQAYFELMSASYGIMPTKEHYNCMVDLFCRTGRFDKVVPLIGKMPFANSVVLHTLLSTCRSWGNLDIGKWTFEQAVKLNKHDAAAYSCMSNICAEAGKQEGKRIEVLSSQKQAVGSSANKKAYQRQT